MTQRTKIYVLDLIFGKIIFSLFYVKEIESLLYLYGNLG